MQSDNDDFPLDVETYASNYTGHARISRMLFIAEHGPGTQMQLEALKIAAEEARQSEDTNKYLQIMDRVNGRLRMTTDKDWVDATERKAAAKLERLDNELNGYKSNLIKESIRMGHNDMGDFYYARGDLQNALKCYLRTRDYCTTPKHIVIMCLAIIKCGVEMGNYVHVNNYVSKAEQTPDVATSHLAALKVASHMQDDPVVMAKLRCAAGLAAMDAKKYKQAALRFTEASAELGGQWSDVIAPQDVATYGGLCALATLTRPDLRVKVIDNIQFREYLEVVPEMREIVADFYASRYARCLAALERWRPALELDAGLARHLPAMTAAIRERALLQYATPFSSVDLASMAAAFNTSIGGLQKELEVLIGSGQVQARIDSHNKVLYAKRTDQRNATFQWALRAGEDCVRESKSLLLRASLLQHDLVQKGSATAPFARGPARPMMPERV